MHQLILIALMSLVIHARALATSLMPEMWENLATTAEFIGVVECVTAGGIVARYRVVDSWKGPAVGLEITIRQGVDLHDQQFPISLVGERFLVFAQKSRPYSITSFISHGRVPLWWRQIPTDLRCTYLIPLKWLAAYLPPLGARTVHLDEFKAIVSNFLKSGKAEQERLLMLASARRNLHIPYPVRSAAVTADVTQEAVKLYDSLKAAKSVTELWQRILAHASKAGAVEDPPTIAEKIAQRHRSALLAVLSQGREQCRDLFEKADLSKLPWPPQDWERALAEIRRNLTPETNHPRSPDPDANKPATPADIAQAEALLSKPWDFQTEPAFELLCRHAPASVATFLLRWQPTEEYPHQQFGYVLGSAFGHLCSLDRTIHLRALLAARDPWIRSSAAVYLRFDEPKAGIEALRKATLIEGDPGAWAALVLVSRGDKTAMMRALEVMVTPQDAGLDSVNHGILQNRFRVLLSNAASASKVPQPPNPPKEHPEGEERVAVQKKWHEAIVRWWNEHQEKIILADPWIKHLEEQKVD